MRDSGIVVLKNPPSIISTASVVGEKEFSGPLSKYFDLHDNDDKFGMDTWEKAESKMQHLALNCALAKVKLRPSDIDLIFAGDLLNQCVSSTYGLLDFQIPYLGLYGACSTAAEGMIMASLVLESGHFEKCAAVSSSHYCSAERQFRFPLEYGGQRTPTSQWTVTGSGAFILEKNAQKPPYIREIAVGKIRDMGISDANNMGAAMAPAAVETLVRYFDATGKKPQDFDIILTGDLGYEGHKTVIMMMKTYGFDLSKNYNDCGLLIYNRNAQDMHAGGSGCGCSAVVAAGYLMNEIKEGRVKNALFMGTGALMSPSSIQQGLSIPAIGHLVHISSEKGD